MQSFSDLQFSGVLLASFMMVSACIIDSHKELDCNLAYQSLCFMHRTPLCGGRDDQHTDQVEQCGSL